MISVVISFNKIKKISKVIIKGHSNFEIKGKDLVCAAVSAITNGTVNFLAELFPKLNKISLFSNKVIIEILKDNFRQNLCLKLMIFQLENLSFYYPEFITISKNLK